MNSKILIYSNVWNYLLADAELNDKNVWPVKTRHFDEVRPGGPLDVVLSSTQSVPCLKMKQKPMTSLNANPCPKNNETRTERPNNFMLGLIKNY